VIRLFSELGATMEMNCPAAKSKLSISGTSNSKCLVRSERCDVRSSFDEYSLRSTILVCAKGHCKRCWQHCA